MEKNHVEAVPTVETVLSFNAKTLDSDPTVGNLNLAVARLPIALAKSLHAREKIVVCGPSGMGKTRLVEYLSSMTGSISISTDDYSQWMKQRINLIHSDAKLLVGVAASITEYEDLNGWTTGLDQNAALKSWNTADNRLKFATSIISSIKGRKVIFDSHLLTEGIVAKTLTYAHRTSTALIIPIVSVRDWCKGLLKRYPSQESAKQFIDYVSRWTWASVAEWLHSIKPAREDIATFVGRRTVEDKDKNLHQQYVYLSHKEAVQGIHQILLDVKNIDEIFRDLVKSGGPTLIAKV